MAKPSREVMQSILDQYHQCLWSMVLSQDLYGFFTPHEMAWMVQLSAQLESIGFKTWTELSTALTNEKG